MNGQEMDWTQSVTDGWREPMSISPPFLGKGRGQKAEFLRMQIYRLADSLNIQNLVAEFF